MVHSIFADDLSDAGSPRSVHGVPDEARFQTIAHRSSNGQREATRLLSIQIDSVWGLRNACPRDRSDVAPGDRCFGPTTMPTRSPE